MKGEAQAPGVVASQARAVAILCMVVTFASGISSATEFLRLSSDLVPATDLPRGTPQAEWLAQFSELFNKAAQPDRELLRAVLLLLAVSLSFTFVCAMRVVRPGGLPREGVRKLLSASALVTAVLRTVEGAAHAALCARLARSLSTLGGPPGWEAWADTGRLSLGQVMVGSSVFLTGVVAGSLLLASQYFRSARVRDWAAVQDRAPP